MNYGTIKALAALTAAFCGIAAIIAAILAVNAVLSGTGEIKQLIIILAGITVYAVYINYAARRIMRETERLLERKTAS